MATKSVPAVFIGGPLDNLTYSPITRWPAFLDEEGRVLDPRKGDRIMNPRGRVPTTWPSRCYVLRTAFPQIRTYEYVTADD